MLVGILVVEGNWVEQLYVEPSMTGRGIGAGLVKVAKREHPEGLRLWTFASNVRASGSTSDTASSRASAPTDGTTRRARRTSCTSGVAGTSSAGETVAAVDEPRDPRHDLLPRARSLQGRSENRRLATSCQPFLDGAPAPEERSAAQRHTCPPPASTERGRKPDRRRRYLGAEVAPAAPRLSVDDERGARILVSRQRAGDRSASFRHR